MIRPGGIRTEVRMPPAAAAYRGGMTTPSEPLLSIKANHLRPAVELSGMGAVLARNPLLLLTGGFGHLADGGRLVVRPDGVSFEPHSANLPGGAWGASAARIRGVRSFQRLLTNGLEFELQDGSARRFVVADRNKRLDELRRLGLPVS